MTSIGETSTLPPVGNPEPPVPSAPPAEDVKLNEPSTSFHSSTTSDTNLRTDSTSRPENNDESSDERRDDSKTFECNICLDTAKDAVVSVCGHLFCWPCLHKWLETRPLRQLCPVCKAAISREKVIPLYGRGNSKQEDPRTKVPPRPSGQRVEPEPAPGLQGFGFGDGGFHMSFGIGAFPFGFFTSSLNFGEARPSAPMRGTAQFDEDQFISKVFLWVAIAFICWLLLV